MFTLSPIQKKVLDEIIDWQKKTSEFSFITLGGYAGTGKTTLIGHLRNTLHKEKKDLKVAFVCYTGKAARVLRNSLRTEKALYEKDTVGTIHSLIYSPIVNEKEEIIGWQRKKKIDQDLIIVDEASMVDEYIWRDICSYEKPIIAVGDHGQLPPIRGNFNLMAKPMLTLTEIHRQAKGNPIIQVSILARELGEIPFGDYGTQVKKLSKKDSDSQDIISELLNSYTPETLILCGYNATRVKLNGHIRKMLGFEFPSPTAGDRVICLRNNHEKNVFNGMLGTVNSVHPKTDAWYKAEIAMDDEEDPFRGLIAQAQFNAPGALNFTENRSLILESDLFDFGYAITVHKAQGSQAPRVILFEERFSRMDDEMWRRWLYTAVTRAQEELFIIG
ncbi:AAA family ATPase [Candidatus Roizmanbacteria bacterium]|nr:AAA family ATPase [Candidatus Roizmanbacteria bacterium]